MKLSEFLTESLYLNEAFANRLNINDWLNNLPRKYKQYKSEISELLDGFFGSMLPDYVLTDSGFKEFYFKIPYNYADLCNKYKNGFEIKGIPGYLSFKFDYNKKWDCYYVYGNGDRDKLHIFQLGAGSEGQIDTKTQESALASIWNKIIDKFPNTNIKGELKDAEFNDFIKNIIIDNKGSLNESWQKSIYFEIECIKNYIGQDFLNYKIDRYGEGEVGKAYAKFIQNYALKAQKDTVDPSDVILYKKDNIDSILSSLKSLSNGINFENRMNFRKQFVDTLWNTKELRGISLKKMTKSSTAEEFNVGEHVDKFKINKVINYHVADNGVNVIVGGDFDFCNAVDSHGNIIKCKELQISLRSFGGYIGCDVKSVTKGSNKTPLGKCSVTVWRDNILKRLNITINDCKNKKSEVLAKFVQMLKNSGIDSDGVNDFKYNTDEIHVNPNIKITIADITSIIRSAIKDGPESIPFVLIH